MTCIYENVFPETDRFLAISLHSLSSIELPIHLFGQYLIHYKTPGTMSSVKWIIFQLHAVCAVFDVFCTLMFSLFFWIPSPGGYPVGLLSYFKVNVIVQLYAGCNLLIAVGFSCLVFFENRYDVIVIGTMNRSGHRTIKRLIYFFLNFAYFSAALVYIFLHFPDQNQGRIHIKVLWPCIPNEWIDNPNFFIMNTTRHDVIALTMSVITLIIVQCAYFIFRTIYRLFYSVGNVSKATRKIQWKFFLALVIQATVPLLAIAAPILYYALAWKLSYYNQKYNNYAMILIGFNGLFTTIVMILAHRPYRQAVSQMFTTKEPKRSRTGPMMMEVSQ